MSYETIPTGDPKIAFATSIERATDEKQILTALLVLFRAADYGYANDNPPTQEIEKKVSARMAALFPELESLKGAYFRQMDMIHAGVKDIESIKQPFFNDRKYTDIAKKYPDKEDLALKVFLVDKETVEKQNLITMMTYIRARLFLGNPIGNVLDKTSPVARPNAEKPDTSPATDTQSQETQIDPENVAFIVTTLENEKRMLEQLLQMVQEMRSLLKAANIDGVNHILDRRSDLMQQLKTTESSLPPLVGFSDNEVIKLLNQEVLRLANEIVNVDEESHLFLEQLKKKS